MPAGWHRGVAKQRSPHCLARSDVPRGGVLRFFNFHPDRRPLGVVGSVKARGGLGLCGGAGAEGVGGAVGEAGGGVECGFWRGFFEGGLAVGGSELGRRLLVGGVSVEVVAVAGGAVVGCYFYGVRGAVGWGVVRRRVTGRRWRTGFGAGPGEACLFLGWLVGGNWGVWSFDGFFWDVRGD